MTIVRSDYFWLSDPADESARDTILAGREKLRAIEVVRSLKTGVPATTEARDVVDNTFSVFEQTEFDSPED